MAAQGRNSWIKSLFTAGALIRLAIAIGVAVAIWLGISAWIGDRTQITIDQFTNKPVDLLSPQWLHLLAVVPAPLASDVGAQANARAPRSDPRLP